MWSKILAFKVPVSILAAAFSIATLYIRFTTFKLAIRITKLHSISTSDFIKAQEVNVFNFLIQKLRSKIRDIFKSLPIESKHNNYDIVRRYCSRTVTLHQNSNAVDDISIIQSQLQSEEDLINVFYKQITKYNDFRHEGLSTADKLLFVYFYSKVTSVSILNSFNVLSARAFYNWITTTSDQFRSNDFEKVWSHFKNCFYGCIYNDFDENRDNHRIQQDVGTLLESSSSIYGSDSKNYYKDIELTSISDAFPINSLSLRHIDNEIKIDDPRTIDILDVPPASPKSPEFYNTNNCFYFIGNKTSNHQISLSDWSGNSAIDFDQKSSLNNFTDQSINIESFNYEETIHTDSQFKETVMPCSAIKYINLINNNDSRLCDRNDEYNKKSILSDQTNKQSFHGSLLENSQPFTYDSISNARYDKQTLCNQGEEQDKEVKEIDLIQESDNVIVKNGEELLDDRFSANSAQDEEINRPNEKDVRTMVSNYYPAFRKLINCISINDWPLTSLLKDKKLLVQTLYMIKALRINSSYSYKFLQKYFVSLQNIREIDISGLGLTDLNKSLLDLKFLTSLNISSNPLSRECADYLLGIECLENLFASYTGKQFVSSFLQLSLDKTEQSSNCYSKIGKNRSKQQEIEAVSQKNNKIEHSGTQIDTININNTQISQKHIESQCLKSLFVENNELENTDLKNACYAFSSLEILSFSNNNISDISSLINCSKLAYIDLSFNPIEQDPLIYLIRCRDLRKVIIKGTRIQEIKLDFEYFPNITRIELSDYVNGSNLPIVVLKGDQPKDFTITGQVSVIRI